MLVPATLVAATRLQRMGARVVSFGNLVAAKRSSTNLPVSEFKVRNHLCKHGSINHCLTMLPLVNRSPRVLQHGEKSRSLLRCGLSPDLSMLPPSLALLTYLRTEIHAHFVGWIPSRKQPRTSTSA